MKYTKLAAVALASMMMLSACGQSANSDNQIVMTVGDTQITESEFNYYMNTYKENYNMGQAKKSSLEYCQRNQLIVEVAKAMDITLTDDEAKQVKSTISNFKAQQGGKKAGDKLLKKYGVDDDIMETIISASMQPASAQWICCSPTAALVFMQIGGQCSMAQSCWC